MSIATFPGRLEARAYQRGLKPAALAELAGVSRSFIYDILRGRSKRPDRQTLALVAAVLKVDVDWLISGLGWVEGDLPVALSDGEEFVPIRLAAPRASMGGALSLTIMSKTQIAPTNSADPGLNSALV